MTSTNNPRKWKAHGRPLSGAELAFARTLPNVRIVPKVKPAQTWLSAVQPEEEMGVGESEFPMSLQP